MSCSTDASERTSAGVALITGASAGIGAVFARKLARRGYDLILVARRQERLEALATELHDACGVDAKVMAADLSNDAGIAGLVGRMRELGPIDLLINNAGFGTLNHFAETDLASQDAMAHLHVVATMQLTHAVLGGMIERGRGGVINVASVAGFFQSPSNVMYCSTKAWMISFTDGLSIELEGTGVTAMVLCPGFTYSEFHDVMGVDRATVPKSWWMSADVVVEQALRDFEQGKRICIPGFRYRFMVWLSKHLPRWLRNWAARRRHRRIAQQGLTEQM